MAKSRLSGLKARFFIKTAICDVSDDDGRIYHVSMIGGIHPSVLSQQSKNVFVFDVEDLVNLAVDLGVDSEASSEFTLEDICTRYLLAQGCEVKKTEHS
ncbi:hypothetical protein KDN34_03050 [Shewanella yunxiaonensis]|uniref:Uncharacterized protein n=1 Tax=Shewanella yunxiaonensis TaxID=2829809 RepID=A0ABX7YVT9_9GAMM|nr:hypothetical protein [Shewanella yunxiaonensis]QUN06455.1 hypothetical protein KDN34_03050 [Shewanella yunxiaonensis]